MCFYISYNVICFLNVACKVRTLRDNKTIYIQSRCITSEFNDGERGFFWRCIASGLPWYKFNHIHASLVYILTRHGWSVAFNIYLRIISARLIKAYQLPLLPSATIGSQDPHERYLLSVIRNEIKSARPIYLTLLLLPFHPVIINSLFSFLSF